MVSGKAEAGAKNLKVVALINKSAGAVARKGDIDRAVRDGFAARGVEADVRLVEGREIGELSQRFVAENKSRSGHGSILVVGGGDGTLGSAASALAGTDVVLGVLPLGTLNHFAKDLGVPLDLTAAIDTIATGKPVTVDVAEVNGRVFLNNSSIGIYPFFVAKRSTEQRRRGFGKLAAIGPALMRTLRSASWQAVHVAAQGTRERLRTPCVFVGNNFYDIADLGHRASLTSKELCVYVVKQQSWFGLALLPFKIAFGMIDSARDLEIYRAGSLQITSHRRAMLVSLDGEAVSMDTPLNFQIRPAALKVLLPAKKARTGDRS
ncbi:diacylglycerol kinase [Mesorhizobium huakuii]|uniref:diacylglycerol/lipid kinase family protein n=1 Tax=Mesorhizobium huakuii TaxID=28104 RepID=UPI00235BCB21|nr:diacylglycerol kinase family protein [Mesorhizobium huakuii]GLQ79641.1 diacylglycerol kinase [Mesorhizobium huakuii]